MLPLLMVEFQHSCCFVAKCALLSLLLWSVKSEGEKGGHIRLKENIAPREERTCSKCQHKSVRLIVTACAMAPQTRRAKI
jgi:hypothetical protein